MLTTAVQSTATLRTLVEIIDRKRSKCNPNREVKVITIPAHLDDVEPQEQDLNVDPNEAGDNGLKERQRAAAA